VDYFHSRLQSPYDYIEFESLSITEIIKGSPFITENIKSYNGFVVKYLERETLEVSHVCQDSASLLLGVLSGLMGQHQFRPSEKGFGNVAPSGVL
jgi:hypothetical protein